jgi:hypothetical protein
MRKPIVILNFLALCTLSLAANFIFSPADTHAQSAQALEQQADREVGPLAAPTGEPRAGRGTYFAVVNFTLERGSDVIDVTRTSPGEFRVTFADDVSKCAYTASVSTTFGPNGQATVKNAINGTRPQSVIVNTYTPDGFQSDRAFHLIVSCS